MKNLMFLLLTTGCTCSIKAQYVPENYAQWQMMQNYMQKICQPVNFQPNAPITFNQNFNPNVFVPTTPITTPVTAEKTPNRNNSKTNTNRDSFDQVCTTCHGGGKCHSCHGTGKRTDNYFATGSDSRYKCGVCGGNGICSVCRGSGRR